MIDLSTIDTGRGHDVLALRPAVPGRVLHIDGDFLCYMCTFAEDIPFAVMYSNLVSMVNRFKAMASADSVMLHLTASLSTKNGRADIALLKPYQANRSKDRKPEHLEAMRLKVAEGKDFPARYWTTVEADDGMSSMQWDAIRKGAGNLSVILSKDKDLSIVPGWHLTWEKDDDCALVWHNWLGTLSLVKKSAVKCVGTGAKFFWAQMLMGDTADNISGIPKVGAVWAYNALVHCTTHLEMMETVVDAYRDYSDRVGFKRYDTGAVLAWREAFMSEAQLLWMNREHGLSQYDSVARYLAGIIRGEVDIIESDKVNICADCNSTPTHID